MDTGAHGNWVCDRDYSKNNGLLNKTLWVQSGVILRTVTQGPHVQLHARHINSTCIEISNENMKPKTCRNNTGYIFHLKSHSQKGLSSWHDRQKPWRIDTLAVTVAAARSRFCSGLRHLPWSLPPPWEVRTVLVPLQRLREPGLRQAKGCPHGRKGGATWPRGLLSAPGLPYNRAEQDRPERNRKKAPRCKKKKKKKL